MIATVPSQAQDGSFEQASAVFIQQYIQEWSGPAPAALAYMDQIYADQVEFYGKALTHAELMNLKRKFAVRWPERTLVVRPDSVQVLCDPNHLCAAQAIFDWRYRSPERQAVSSGSASLKLELQDGMTILSENGTVIPSNRSTPPTMAPRGSIPPVATQPTSPTDIPAAPVAEASPQQEEPSPQRDKIAALRNTYFAHAADKDWVTAWLAQKRDFSGQGTFAGSTEDQAGPGPAGVLRTVNFTSAVGTIACINPDNAGSLKVGEKVNIHGVVTIFIEDVMYLGQCSIQPG